MTIEREKINDLLVNTYMESPDTAKFAEALQSDCSLCLGTLFSGYSAFLPIEEAATLLRLFAGESWE